MRERYVMRLCTLRSDRARNPSDSIDTTSVV
jgi:hypothetical protein